MTDDDIDPSVASVASVGHTGGVKTSRSGGMCNGVHLESAYVSRRPFQVLSLGAPSRPAVTRQGSGC